MKIALLITVMLSLSASAAISDNGNKTLPAQLHNNAFYQGALLDAAHTVNFYPTGQLAMGILKQPYQRDGFTFKAGTSISFFTNGQVRSGTLEKDNHHHRITLLADSFVVLWSNGQLHNATLKKGSKPENRNLILPVDMEVQYSAAGHVVSVSPFHNQVYQLFGRLLKQQAQLAYDEQNQHYSLYKGILAQGQIIASVSHGSYQSASSASAIIAPANSQFQLYQQNPFYDAGNGPYDRYRLAKTFTLNGKNFGDGVTLLVKDMQLKGIQLGQSVTLLGRKFSAGQLLRLDEQGNIVAP